MSQHFFELGSAYHTFKDKCIELAEEAYNAALAVGGAALTKDLLAFVGQLLGGESSLLVL